MTRTTSARSATRRRTPARLSKELVVDAAIRLLRRVGSQKFSLRALARELGVTPMAIYRHVPNKEALLEEVRHSVLELVPLVVDKERAEPRGDGPLSEQEIVEQALCLVAEHGLARLSMRALAERLKVTAMSIYRHVPNKEALLSRMIDAVIERVPQAPPDPSTWPSDFREHAIASWREFSKHPGLVGSFLGKHSQKVVDQWSYERSILMASGLDRRTAAVAVTVYHTFMLGLYRTHSFLDYLVRHDTQGSGVSTEAIRRYGERMMLDELLEFALAAITSAVREGAAGSAARADSPRGHAEVRPRARTRRRAPSSRS